MALEDRSAGWPAFDIGTGTGVLAAVLEAAGETAQAVAIAPEPDMDEAWAEPEAFDGCATRGQNRPDQPQPIHIVRKARPQSSQGVSP